ncbi:MAG: hypothetical protein RI988_645 [Pseudomonadota bacterium]|jgi:hypothetical protein
MSADAIRLPQGLRAVSQPEPRVEGEARRAPRVASARAQGATTELRMSAAASSPQTGGVLGAVQEGVAAAQSGLADTQAAQRALSAAPGSASLRVPLLMLGSRPMAEALVARHQAAGSDLQAWLDIATGRLALDALAHAMAQRAPEPEAPDMARDAQPAAAPAQADTPRQELAPAALQRAGSTAGSAPGLPEPAAEAVPVRTHDVPRANPSMPVAPAAPAATADAQAALEQARGGFESALQRFDAQLAAWGTRPGRTPPQPSPDAAARRAAANVVREPVQAHAAHGAVSLPGVLSLLQWDLTPLNEPAPSAQATRAGSAPDAAQAQPGTPPAHARPPAHALP